MTKMPSSAMVLAAGLGKRIRPLASDRPKPLVEVAGKALIDYALDRFAAAGVGKAVVNVHYHADMMEAHVRKRRKPDIAISDERALLMDTGGGFKKAAPHLEGEAVFTTNTDAILIDERGFEACARLAAAFDPERMDALLLLSDKDRSSGLDSAGDFDLSVSGRIDFRKGERADYFFTGLQIIKPKLLDGLPDEPFSMRLLWMKAIASGKMFGLVHKGFWMHVGDPEGHRAAESRLAAKAG